VRTGAGAGVASVTITPIDPLTVVKSFNPASIQVNGASTVGIVVTNGNPFPLTGIALTDNLPAGVTINGALTTFGGNPLCTGASVTPPGTIRITGGTLAANSTCAIGVPVTSTAAGTYVNLSFAVTTTEGVSTNSNAATLVVSNVPVPPASPTPIPTATPVVVNPPVIPQVFQHVPLGIFTNPRPNTPTPVVRAVAVAPVSGPGAIAPVLRPPSTGDAGLQDEGHSIWYYVPFIAIATVFAGSAGAVWRWQRR
jgi:hypothetical protein